MDLYTANREPCSRAAITMLKIHGAADNEREKIREETRYNRENCPSNRLAFSPVKRLNQMNYSY
jgi:hypothetical protein